MGREWKPGDVAITRYGQVMFVKKHHDECVPGWVFASDGSFIEDDPSDIIRPLVRIDPEEMAEVERLGKSLDPVHWYGSPGYLQAVLREFANPSPPKPDEPTGLGAVVEEADGTRWAHNGFGWWCREAVNQHSVRHDYPWEKVAAVRVLSDGVVVTEPLADWERDLLRGDA